MFGEILTPQGHRPRRHQKPDMMRMKDGRMIILFPNGDTKTLLPNGISLHTSKIDRGVWVKKPCGDIEYIPPLDQYTKEFLDEKIKAREQMKDARMRHRDNKHDPFWDVKLHEQIMDRGTFT